MTNTTSNATRPDLIGILTILLSGICFSAAIFFVRRIEGLDVMTVSFYRAFSAFLFFTLLLVRWREPLKFGSYRRYLPYILISGVGIAITMSLYTYSIQHATAAAAALLVNSAPLYVALLSPFLLKEARPHYTWPSLALAVIGMVLVVGPDQLQLGSTALVGVLAGALSGLTYTIPMFAGRRLSGKVSGFTTTWWNAGLAAMILLPFAMQADMSVAVSQLHLLVPMGIISMGLSYMLMFVALQRVSTQIVSVGLLMEPVSGVLMGIFLFQEYLTATSALGCVMVLISIWLISR